MPTNAGGTGTIAGRGLGDLVTELASSWNSHGGGRCFVRTVNRFRQRVLFVWETAGGTHSGTGSPGPPGTADRKRQLIRGKGLVARISSDYRAQLPVVGMDNPEPAVPCHGGIARLEETVINRIRSVGRVVRRPYSDSEESDNNVWYAEIDDSALGQPTVDLCGEGCAQLDDFKWFLPTNEWAGDLSAPDSEIEASDSENGVNCIKPVSTPVQAEITKQQLLRPPVVNQTRPREGYHTVVPRRLRRGRDVRTADDPSAVDARQISAASETVAWEIHRKSECVMTVVPTSAAGSQADYEVVQPRPPGYGYTDPLPLGSGSLESLRIDTPDGSPPAEIKISRSLDTQQTEWSVTSTEMAGGSPPADIDICESPDTLQTEWSAMCTEMAGGSPPADRDICDGPDRLQAEISTITRTMSGGSPPAEIRNSRSPDRLQKEISVTSTEIAGGSPPAHIDICESPDRLQTMISVTSTEMAGGNPPADRDNCESPELLQRAGSVTAVVSEKWMERFVIKPKVMCSDDSASDDDPAGRSSDASSIASVQNQIPTVVCVQTVVLEKWMDRFVFGLVECLSPSRTSAVARTFGPAVSEEYSPVVFAGGGGGCRCIPPGRRRVRHGSGVWPTVGRIRCSSGVCPACCRLEVPGRVFGEGRL